jgi:predicted Zn-dependent protease
MTQLGSVTQEQIANEQLKEQQLAIQSQLEQQRRLNDVAFPLLQAAVPLCHDAVTTRIGVTVGNRGTFLDDFVRAAEASGFSDTLAVTGVAKGSAAARAGLAVGDRILSASGVPITPGASAAQSFLSLVTDGSPNIRLKTRRDSAERTVVVGRDTVCNYGVAVVKDDQLNAFADGKNVYVTSTMLRFAASDDELATVVGHEIAHNAMHHVDAKKTNAVLGGIFGALLDIAAARNGINTGGQYTNQFAALGATVFSQDFEREADYVGLYILAAARRPTQSAANFWRRMAAESPNSIKFASTHPTTAERFVRLEQWQGEIGRKLASGQPLQPEMKSGLVSPALQLARITDASTRDGTTAAREVSLAGALGRTDTASGVLPRNSNQGSAVAATERKPTAPAKAAPATPPAVVARQPQQRTLPQSSDRAAVAIIGASESDSASAAAVDVFRTGKIYFDRHEWGKAEELFRRALRLDGSVAAYHAALGSVEMVFERWEDAEAEYTAAMLIDVSNPEYRAQVLEARRRKAR